MYQFRLICLQLFAQVQIIEDESPLHIPRDAFSHLATVPTFHSGKVPRAAAASPLPYEHSDDEAGLQSDEDFNDSESDSGPEEESLLRRLVLSSIFIFFLNSLPENFGSSLLTYFRVFVSNFS